jgi:hypothetical protein
MKSPLTLSKKKDLLENITSFFMFWDGDGELSGNERCEAGRGFNKKPDRNGTDLGNI